MVIVEKYAIMHLRNICVYFKIYWYTKHQTPKKREEYYEKEISSNRYDSIVGINFSRV